MKRYLLDTDTCIYLIKKQSPEIIERFKSHKISAVAVSIISYFELEYGVQNSTNVRQNKTALNQFVNSIHLIKRKALPLDRMTHLLPELHSRKI